MIQFNVIFQIKSAEFKKSLKFGSNLKKAAKKYLNIFNLILFFILIDLNKIFPIKSSQFNVFNTVESYDEKTDENCQISTLPKSV